LAWVLFIEKRNLVKKIPKNMEGILFSLRSSPIMFYQEFQRRKILFLFLSLVFLFLGREGNAFAQEKEKSFQQLIIKDKKIQVEVARSEKEQEKGLMFRERLGKDEGMLFVYEREGFLTFWMKNTRIPLSIAFISKNGRIVDIQDMEPFSLQSHVSAFPAQFALEMNQGWFQKNRIQVGDPVKLPSSLLK
jgi:uncharacterized protein